MIANSGDIFRKSQYLIDERYRIDLSCNAVYEVCFRIGAVRTQEGLD